MKNKLFRTIPHSGGTGPGSTRSMLELWGVRGSLGGDTGWIVIGGIN